MSRMASLSPLLIAAAFRAAMIVLCVGYEATASSGSSSLMVLRSPRANLPESFLVTVMSVS
eukprot:CAMPEP_0175998876 /NCGR_PEP_ID=MMETSP0108-20121206/57001_1 /TAXON_ID=195067 ORGANISM="Goniomonas pacifica, Strain CCMP1869" /NCGR_SAMPLE_ID=MMETSP0108 /ASSEMBLY_ACC=CAM_ASM_000204 /LENGTH=60 /DNA_ID=CAMNT_0017331299 /DNA_START=79 /DNA_END=257 /DNA_ORIENTATION=+